MDGATEPIIAVLGHPIAGNPSQFALERAFKAMRLDWRVLSLDVHPENIDAAITGAKVMGFRGLLLDDVNAAAAGHLRQRVTPTDTTAEAESSQQIEQSQQTEKVSEGAPPTCFFWDSTDKQAYRSENAESSWLEELIRSHFRSPESVADGDAMGPVLWIGDTDVRFPKTMVDIDTQSPIAWADSESIEHSKLIVLSEPVNVSKWPANDQSTLVIDLSDSQENPDGGNHAALSKLGYTFISVEERRAAALSQCLTRWTGTRPPIDIIQEAIEEYLAV
ncbi:hypothetical protein Pla52nx_004053 [Stieleria varia]|uniref:Shikimate 5-dehydrogenase n=2 Tax=Stieleria varia TaxID=2528005 RepID=A0A5C6ARK2_9BACT|nr:hypothetical protein Pla52n_31700 [Stieleria varia]